MKLDKLLNPKNKQWMFLNTFFWGVVLWLVGYILGFVFYAFVPQDMIGWFITPIGLIVMLWVLFKKIERKRLQCYFMAGVLWTFIAVVFDFLFIVLLLNSTNYYKPDIYIYYALTLTVPVLVGWYKLRKKEK